MADQLEIVTIRLFKNDKERLNEFYPHAGHNKVIRTLVRKHIQALERKLQGKIPPDELNLTGDSK